MACAVEDFECDGRARVRPQIVGDDRAVGRVLARGFFGRERRVCVDVALDTVGRLRLKEKRVRRGDAFVNLPERRDVVENPEGASVRADDDVVFVYDEVADGTRSHVQTKRLPVVTIVERDEDCALRACEEKTFALRVFTHDVDWIVGQTFDNLSPSSSAVVRAKDVRAHIVEAYAVDGSVGRLIVE